FGNSNSGTPLNCGLKYGFVQPNLQPITSLTDPNAFTGTIQSQNLNFKQGTVQQFNLNVEHQLPGSVVVTAGYAGSRGNRILMDGQNLNVGSPAACGVAPGYTLGCGPGGTAFDPPYTFGNHNFSPFSVMANITDAGHARYDSLQL